MIEEIKQKIEELLKLGKEKSEMELWLNMLPAMNNEEQKELLESLEKELTLIQAR